MYLGGDELALGDDDDDEVASRHRHEPRGLQHSLHTRRRLRTRKSTGFLKEEKTVCIQSGVLPSVKYLLSLLMKQAKLKVLVAYHVSTINTNLL